MDRSKPGSAPKGNSSGRHAREDVIGDAGGHQRSSEDQFDRLRHRRLHYLEKLRHLRFRWRMILRRVEDMVVKRALHLVAALGAVIDIRLNRERSIAHLPGGRNL